MQDHCVAAETASENQNVFSRFLNVSRVTRVFAAESAAVINK